MTGFLGFVTGGILGSYLLKASDAELDSWKAQAKAEGLRLAAWIREACDAKLAEPEAVGRSLTAGQREAGPLKPEAHSEAAQPPFLITECARAWSHRKGTYCRNCGFV